MNTKKNLTPEQVKANKAAYMRDWYRKNKASSKQKNKQSGKQSIKFSGKEKSIVRDTILASAKKTGDMLDFYGASGEMYKKVKKEAPKVKITSIDSGKDFNNTEALQKLFKGKKDLQVTCFENYARTATEKEQKGTIWLDYCGPMSSMAIQDLEIAYKAMKKSGYIYITFLKARESFMAKDTAREVVNEIIPKIIQKTLKKTGIKTKAIFNHEYQSTPDYAEREVNRHVPMGVYGFKYTKDEAFIKRLAKKTQKKEAEKIKSMYTRKQINEMVNALNIIGYTITK